MHLPSNRNTPIQGLKSTWDLVYPGQNCDVREILRNLIGCWEDWELEKTDFSWEIKPRIGVLLILIEKVCEIKI